MSQINIAILGAGHIAGSMAKAIKGLQGEVKAYAVASRSRERAEAFAAEWNFEKAYGSYEELVQDPEVDLIYVATPHSHHYEHAKLCLEHDKAVLVEKAFTANAVQAEELVRLARQRKVFLSEAIWTRFLPARHIVQELLEQKIIGEPISIEAEFSIPLTHVQRLVDPALAGGTLLDLGMYALTFASMYFGDDIVKVESTCEKYETGVDAVDDIHYTYRDGKTAHLHSSLLNGRVNEGSIRGTAGRIDIVCLNNYSSIRVYDRENNLVAEPQIPKQINGYEYEVLACKRALEDGALECEEMPHEKTLEIMRQMDALRAQWGVKYPFE